jgi:hypothetical protein
MLVTVAHRTTPTAKAALAKMPLVEVLTVSMTARTHHRSYACGSSSS